MRSGAGAEPLGTQLVPLDPAEWVAAAGKGLGKRFAKSLADSGAALPFIVCM